MSPPGHLVERRLLVTFLDEIQSLYPHDSHPNRPCTIPGKMGVSSPGLMSQICHSLRLQAFLAAEPFFKVKGI